MSLILHKDPVRLESGPNGNLLVHSVFDQDTALVLDTGNSGHASDISAISHLSMERAVFKWLLSAKDSVGIVPSIDALDPAARAVILTAKGILVQLKSYAPLEKIFGWLLSLPEKERLHAVSDESAAHAFLHDKNTCPGFMGVIESLDPESIKIIRGCPVFQSAVLNVSMASAPAIPKPLHDRLVSILAGRPR